MFLLVLYRFVDCINPSCMKLNITTMNVLIRNVSAPNREAMMVVEELSCSLDFLGIGCGWLCRLLSVAASLLSFLVSQRVPLALLCASLAWLLVALVVLGAPLVTVVHR